MKQTLRQTIDLLRQHKGQWVNRASIAAVGGGRFGGRIAMYALATDYLKERVGTYTIKLYICRRIIRGYIKRYPNDFDSE